MVLIIGMQKEEPLRRFVSGMGKGRFEPANGEATLCGMSFETNDQSGRAISAEMVSVGGFLSTTL